MKCGPSRRGTREIRFRCRASTRSRLSVPRTRSLTSWPFRSRTETTALSRGGFVLRLSTMMLVVVLASSAALAQQPTGDGSPIALHLGPAFTRVADADFEVVGSLSGQDLFAQTDVRDSTVDFGVFVSQRLWGTNGDPARLYATLGSGISRPGRLLFLGGSIAAARAFLTVGLATA